MAKKTNSVKPLFYIAGKEGETLHEWGGLNTAQKDFRALKKGETYDAINWITRRGKDGIELRRGTAILGETRRNVADQHVSGIGVGYLSNGDQVPFFTYAQKIMYYDGSDTVEVDTPDILPAAANDEDMNFIPYNNLAGSFMYLVSPHSSIYKIPVANPGSVVDQAKDSNGLIQNFKFGWASINQAVFQGMNRYGSNPSSRDSTGFYLGGVDQNGGASGYPTVSGTVATGNGVSVTFSGTLPAYTSPSTTPATYFAVAITDSVETFNDDKSGNLVGTLGGTGTINYATGNFSITFTTAPLLATPITATASWEDATDGGIIDFTQDPSDTTGALAQIFRQDDRGGNAMGSPSFQGINYCLHQIRTWQFAITTASNGDRSYQNIPYWSQIGIPYPRAFYETGDGIIYLDNTNPSSPSFSILEIPPGSTNLTVVPVPLSLELDLSNFAFDKCVVFRWGEYDIMSCMTYTNGQKNSYNSVTFIRNIYSGLWNQLDYSFGCLAEYMGTLISGDSLSPNVFTLFSGFDDDGEVIINHWNTSYNDLEMQGLKKIRYLHLSGLIQRTQILKVSISTDFSQYVEVYQILGTGPYVNNSSPVGIGFDTLGSQVIGGGGMVTANPYEIDIPIMTDYCEYISIRFEALEVGYVNVENASYKDIRWKRRRISQYNDIQISPN